MAQEVHVIDLNYRKQREPITVVQAPPITFASQTQGVTPQGIAAGLTLGSMIFSTRLASFRAMKPKSIKLRSSKPQRISTPQRVSTENFEPVRFNVKRILDEKKVAATNIKPPMKLQTSQPKPAGALDTFNVKSIKSEFSKSKSFDTPHLDRLKAITEQRKNVGVSLDSINEQVKMPKTSKLKPKGLSSKTVVLESPVSLNQEVSTIKSQTKREQ